MENNNTIFKAIITANNGEIFAHKVASKLIDVVTDMAINHPSRIMAIQFKDLDPWFVDEYLHQFERIDGQYVFEGEFIYREDLEKKLKPFMKEMCISLLPKGPREKGKHINEREEYGYIQYYEVSPTHEAKIARLKEVIADQNELCWNCNKSVKEFAEKLKKRTILYSGINVKYEAITADIIDEVLKEYIDEG